LNVLVLAVLLAVQSGPDIIASVGIDRRMGERLDPGIVLRDEGGRTVKLGEFFGGRPVILTPVYFECPMVCSMQLNGVVRALRVMPFSAGKDFDIITFSIDPAETMVHAMDKKAHYVRDYGRPGAAQAWHFLTGDAQAIAQLTQQIGFRYIFDETTRQWAHPSAIVVLTPDGRISQYLYGIEHDPSALKYSLIEASGGKIGSVIDQAVLFCYQYNPTTGRYSLAIMRVLRWTSLAMVLSIVAFWLLSGRKQANKWINRFVSFPNRPQHSPKE
jgi:protein SCO1